jgi:hypothetical protein
MSSPGLTGRSSNHWPTGVTGLPGQNIKPGNDTDRVNSYGDKPAMTPQMWFNMIATR